MLPFWKWLNGTYGNYGNRDTSKCITCKVLAAVTTAAGAAVATAVQQQLIAGVGVYNIFIYITIFYLLGRGVEPKPNGTRATCQRQTNK